MAEKKGVGHAYNVDFLNVVFAASSLFLFLSVIWMVWDDFDREWKNTQRRFVQLEYEVTQANLQQAERSVDQNKLGQLEAQRTAAEQKITANQEKVNELQGQITDVENRLYRDTQEYQFAKATFDVDRYDFEARRANEDPSAERKGEAVRRCRPGSGSSTSQMQKTTSERDALQKQLAEFTGESAKLQKEIDEIGLEQRRLQLRLNVLAPSLVKDYFRNAPLLDFMAPTIKVQQLMLPNVVDDVNFTRVAKMDRCQTCHLAIDRVGLRKLPAAVPHPSEPAHLSREATRRIRWIRSDAPCATRGWGSRSASATPLTRRPPMSRSTSGKRSITGKSRTCGTTRCCRSR